MNKVLLFGGTGHLGQKIAAELKRQDYSVTAVVRNEQRATILNDIVQRCIIAEVTKPVQIAGICKGFDIVISSLGKPVSPNDKSKPSFKQIDLEANSAILDEAVKGHVKKFVYVSAFGAENNLHLNYFKTHHQFSEKLKASGIDYTIIKPPAISSSFIDLMEMAEKGRLITMGKGDKLINPIDETDLAKICVDGIKQDNSVIEAGGKTVYSRKQINDIIQRIVDPSKKVRTIPVSILKLGLPLLRLVNTNLYDKIAFFLEVTQHDTIAPKKGDTNLEEYIKKVRK